jgi:hypothetical protein
MALALWHVLAVVAQSTRRNLTQRALARGCTGGEVQRKAMSTAITAIMTAAIWPSISRRVC